MSRLAILLCAVVLLPAAVFAQESSLLPEIPRGKGDACIADPNFMRVNHMDMMKHDRDETMLLGDRGIKFSLKQCVECHAVAGPDSEPVSYKSEKHFCRVCHDYAAVKIDCFQCHNSKPDVSVQATLTKVYVHTSELKDSLTAYLSEVKK